MLVFSLNTFLFATKQMGISFVVTLINVQYKDKLRCIFVGLNSSFGPNRH